MGEFVYWRFVFLSVTQSPQIFEIGSTANITCTAENVFGWTKLEIGRSNSRSLSKDVLFTVEYIEGNVTYSLPKNIEGSVTQDSILLTFRIDEVMCHNVHVEQYTCYLLVGNDNLSKTVDVVSQSRYLTTNWGKNVGLLIAMTNQITLGIRRYVLF